MSIYVLTAVVDRLPLPQASSRPGDAVDDPQIGHEGLAYAVFPGAEKLKTETAGKEGERSMSLAQAAHRTVTIRLYPSIDTGAGPLSAPPDHFRYDLQIPLAYTIFHTGRPAMMSFTKFSKPKGPKEFSLETVDVKHATVNMIWPNAEDFSDASDAVAFSLPLVPITRSRRIEAGIGNIVRRVSDAVDGTGSIPASQELEQAVSAYFKAKEIPPHAMTVWALVYPAAAKDSEKLRGLVSTGASSAKADIVEGSVPDFIRSSLGSPASEWSSYIWTALKEGARLHRVLSGGGGWGKKAGLLSLDPDSSYSASSASVDDADLSGSNFAMDEKQALGEVSKPGDYIQFFAMQDEPAYAEPTSNASMDDHVVSQRSLHFGTIPSSIDLIPEDPGTASLASGKPTLQIFKNHFGALSETGMGIVIKRRMLIQQRRPKRNIVLDEERTNTKIDVPFSTFRMQTAGQSPNFQKGGNDGESKVRGGTVLSTARPEYSSICEEVQQYIDVPMPVTIHRKVQTDSNHIRRVRSGTNVHTLQQKSLQNPATTCLPKGTTKVGTAQPSQSQRKEPSKLVRYELIDAANEDQHKQDMTLKPALTSFQSLPTAQDQQSGVRITKHAMPMLSRRAFVRQRNRSQRHDSDSATLDTPTEARVRHLMTSPSAAELQRKAHADQDRLRRKRLLIAQQAYLSDHAEFDPTVTTPAPAPAEKLIHFYRSNSSRFPLPRIRKHGVDPPPAEEAVGMGHNAPGTPPIARRRGRLRVRTMEMGLRIRAHESLTTFPRRIQSTPGRGIAELKARRAKAAEEAWAVLTGAREGEGEPAGQSAWEMMGGGEGRSGALPVGEEARDRSRGRRTAGQGADEVEDFMALKERRNDEFPRAPDGASRFTGLKEGKNDDLPLAPEEPENNTARRGGRKRPIVVRKTQSTRSLDPEARLLADSIDALLKGV
ncbi:hypothetical protein W97_03274 [Coniosporium apollinis CBS 100218]|uniref:Uncharacterized protein n=1 Tax=Coniosporium apollinis (strain CBS 100218) TaxID=1168221 RepID=R7YQE8_CONA1|nr:uncharacterized protein W97_03274 [Coniosporium apollinis CBS 100218]EON64044.1 hypothetical protein W97_03274 [Coniosporium apollinis CBS 100218]